MSDQSPRSYSAFISHASKDRAEAEAIAVELEQRGQRCWIAPRDVRPGEEYGLEIIRGIESSRCFVLLLSEASNLSQNVRREVERAASKAKPIYPVRIEDVPPSPKLEYFISMHHWLDAWDGQLSQHVERLVAALDSSEEWIGNKILRRRRHFSIGAIAALSVVATATVIVFSSDMRRFFQSDSEQARHDLAALGVAVSADGAIDALKAANGPRLELLRRAGLSTTQVAEALRSTVGANKQTVAEIFFENSRDSSQADDWLRKALAAGLDPNLVLPNIYYEGGDAILNSAFRAGNAAAVLALLEANASPHGYQALWFTEFPTPRFLFPYNVLLDHERFSPEQKHKIALAFQEAGAVNRPIQADSGNAGRASFQSDVAKKVIDASESELGIKIGSTPTICEGGSRTPICAQASKRTGFDWCGFVDGLPKRISWRPKESYDFNLLRIDLLNLITVIGDKAYFLGAETVWNLENYLLVEVSKDGKKWQVFKYMQPEAGMGFCKTDDNSNLVPRYCWRKYNMTYERENKVMMIQDYYKYDVTVDCQAIAH